MKHSIAFSAILLSVVLLFSGCKGDKGDPGVTGPPGYVNVKSFQFSVDSAQWIDAAPGLIYFNESTPLITHGVVDSGTVLIYYDLDGAAWASLPNGFSVPAGQSYSMNYVYGDSFAEIVLGSATMTNAQMKFARKFKVVILEGKASIPKLSQLTYEEVKRIYQLED